jgi:hypothetical protein
MKDSLLCGRKVITVQDAYLLQMVRMYGRLVTMLQARGGWIQARVGRVPLHIGNL